MTDLKNNPYETIKDRWIEDALTTQISKVPEFVYHYTDASGLYGMLNNKKLWLTDYRFLNDTTEFSHIYNLLGDVRTEILSQAHLSDVKRRLLAAISYEKIEGLDSFVFSCSQEKDDLSQWRGYAKEGQGFTIGFDASRLHALSLPNDAEFAFAKVDYEGGDQKLALKRSIDELSAQIDKDLTKGSDIDELIGKAVEAFDDICLNRGALSKHKSFRAEQEWRLISYVNNLGGRIKIRVNGSKLIPYLETDICDDEEYLPIRSIGIGPAFVGSEVVDAVQTLLKISGHNAEIYFADTPYRRS